MDGYTEDLNDSYHGMFRCKGQVSLQGA
jgi:hypothetical protein